MASNRPYSDNQYVQGTFICISPCCKQFIVVYKDDMICSKCKQRVTAQLNDSIALNNPSSNKQRTEESSDKSTATIHLSSQFRINNARINTGTKQASAFTEEQINDRRDKYRRYATDPTFELCDVLCKKCGEYCRYCRDISGDLVYICSNKNCREVNLSV